MSRNPVTNLSNFFQFFFPLRIFLSGRHGPGQLCIASGIKHQSIGSNCHRFELILLVQRLRVMIEVKPGQRLFYIFFDIEQSFSIDFITKDSVARRSLFHKFGENTGFVSVLPLRCHGRQQAVAHRTSAPEGDDFVVIKLESFFIDSIVCLRPGVKNLQIFQGMAANLGIGGRSLMSRTSLSHN